MNTYNFSKNKIPFKEWMKQNPDITALKLSGTLSLDKISYVDKVLFKYPISVLDLSEVNLVDHKGYATEIDTTDARESEDDLSRLEKMLCNRHLTSSFFIEKKTIFSLDKKVLIHLPEKSYLRIPSGVEIIGDFACLNYYQSDNVEFPDGLKFIGKFAFKNCSFRTIQLPNTLVSLGCSTFESCWINSLTLSSGLEIIPSYCFAQNEMEELEIPASVKQIEQGAFSNNPIRKIFFPEGLEVLEGNAFTYLCYVQFPASMKQIARDFYYEEGYEYPEDRCPFVEINENNPYYYSNKGNLYDKITSELYLGTVYHFRKKHLAYIPDYRDYNRKPNVVILKWNPAFSSITMSSYLYTLNSLIRGTFDEYHNWSVWDYPKIHCGDKYYFLKVGFGQVGIVGCGEIISDPYKSEDWSGKGRETHYVDYQPSVILNPDAVEILTSEKLTELIPDFDWYKGHSGMVLTEEQAKILDSAWQDYMEQMKDAFEEKIQKEYQDYVYIEKDDYK